MTLIGLKSFRVRFNRLSPSVVQILSRKVCPAHLDAMDN